MRRLTGDPIADVQTFAILVQRIRDALGVSSTTPLSDLPRIAREIKEQADKS